MKTYTLHYLETAQAGKNEKEPFDEEVINAGVQETSKLNKKYNTNSFPKFHFCLTFLLQMYI